MNKSIYQLMLRDITNYSVNTKALNIYECDVFEYACNLYGSYNARQFYNMYAHNQEPKDEVKRRKPNFEQVKPTPINEP